MCLDLSQTFGRCVSISGVFYIRYVYTSSESDFIRKGGFCLFFQNPHIYRLIENQIQTRRMEFPFCRPGIMGVVIIR